MSWRTRVLGFGAVAAVASAALAIAANLSEIAGWFATDETLAVVEQAKTRIENTDAKVEELLTLLRNQAAASGIDLNIESEAVIRNAIGAIVASGNAQKQRALAQLDNGDIEGAAQMMTRVAMSQASAVDRTSDASAASWREAGALYYSIDLDEAVNCYEQANRLQPDHPQTLDNLGHALIRAGRLDEAAAWLNHALTLNPEPAVRSSLYQGLGSIAKQRGHYELARRHLSQALAIAETAELEPERAGSLISLAQVARSQGDAALATRYLEQALVLSADFNDPVIEARIKSALGVIAASRGDYDTAEALLQFAFDIYEAENDQANQVNTLGNLGAVALLKGETDTAEVLLLESVETGEKLGWQSSVAYDLVNLGGIAVERQDFAAADGYLARAEVIAESVGLRELTPVIVYNRGDVAFARGDLESACRLWRESAPMLTEMGSEHAAAATERAGGPDCPPDAAP